MPTRARDKAAIFATFLRDVRTLFRYLIVEFGFELADIQIDGHECMMTFRKSQRVAVTVACNAGDFPRVMLTGNTSKPSRYRSEEISLDVLIAQRCPARQRAMSQRFPLEDVVVREVLSYYATMLRDCAEDVLRGELDAFYELRSAVTPEHVRRTRAMKKEEGLTRRPRVQKNTPD